MVVTNFAVNFHFNLSSNEQITLKVPHMSIFFAAGHSVIFTKVCSCYILCMSIFFPAARSNKFRQPVLTLLCFNNSYTFHSSPPLRSPSHGLLQYFCCWHIVCAVCVGMPYKHVSLLSVKITQKPAAKKHSCGGPQYHLCETISCLRSLFLLKKTKLTLANQPWLPGSGQVLEDWLAGGNYTSVMQYLATLTHNTSPSPPQCPDFLTLNKHSEKCTWTHWLWCVMGEGLSGTVVIYIFF